MLYFASYFESGFGVIVGEASKSAISLYEGYIECGVINNVSSFMVCPALQGAVFVDFFS